MVDQWRDPVRYPWISSHADAGNDNGDGFRNGFIGEIPAWDGFSILFFKGDFSLMGGGCPGTADVRVSSVTDSSGDGSIGQSSELFNQGTCGFSPGSPGNRWRGSGL